MSIQGKPQEASAESSVLLRKEHRTRNDPDVIEGKGKTQIIFKRESRL
jgi:hypothetical protein